MRNAMNSIKLKIAATITIIALSAGLLEFGSWAVLKIFTTKNNEVVTDTFIFNPINEDGTFDPAHDWVFPIQENANFDWSREEFDVQIRTNSIGLREDFEVDINEVRVAFFGDSFTFGHGVNVGERYTNVFAEKSSDFKATEVVSMSYKNGFQPEHYEYLIRNTKELRPDIYVVGLYLGNDLDADVKETIYDVKSNKLHLPYRLVQSKGQTRVNPTTLAEPFKSLSRYSFTGTLLTKLIGRTDFRRFMFKDGFEGPNAANAVELEVGEADLNLNRALQSIVRLDQIAEDRSGRLVVLLIAQNFYFGDSNPHLHRDLVGKEDQIRNGNNLLKQLSDFCRDKNLNCLDPSPILDRDDFFSKDAHWNPSGHQKVGIYLSEKLFK